MTSLLTEREAAEAPLGAGDIHVAAALVGDGAGRTLVARTRGTTPFMQPGGKLEAGETARQAVARELEEEIGVRLPTHVFRWVGRFTDAAANHPGRLVVADVFAVTVEPDAVRPTNEVEQLEWFSPSERTHLELAPLTVQLLPYAG